MRVFLLSFAVLALSLPSMASAAGSANAHGFYVTASELLVKGMSAMLDKRTKPAMAQMKAAVTTVKAQNEAATKRGSPLYCVSAAAQKKGIGPEFVVKKLGEIPETRRRKLTLTQAWREVLVREYPCS